MEIIYIVNSIVMSFAVSLGVGCSTAAITQFFAAIADGDIDHSERRLMGVTYILLRIAMVSILLTLLVQSGIIYYFVQSLEFISPFLLAVWTVIGVLFLNAIGMTLRYVPSTLGPGIQAGSWYTLGVLLALVPTGLATFSYLQFVLVYVGALFLVVASVNVAMNLLKNR